MKIVQNPTRAQLEEAARNKRTLVYLEQRIRDTHARAQKLASDAVALENESRRLSLELMRFVAQVGGVA